MNKRALFQALIDYSMHGGKNVTPVIQALEQPSPVAPPHSQQTRPQPAGDGEGGGISEKAPNVPSSFQLPKGYHGEQGAVARYAAKQLGKPYVFGSGPDTSSFDCSDLVQWAYGQIGIHLPRTTFDQVKVGREVSPGQLQVGDLVFPTPHHVTMYVGNGKVIAAPHTGTNVQYQPLPSVWRARRIIG